MSDFNERSRYWPSPGIDVPTRSVILPGLSPMRGLYVHVDAGEAVFVPTDEFMRATPLWRLDVLGDIAQSVEQTQQHAAVDCFRRLNQRRPLKMGQRLAAFRRVCDEGGVVLPPNVEALLILDDQFSLAWRQGSAKLRLGRRDLARGLAVLLTPGRVNRIAQARHAERDDCDYQWTPDTVHSANAQPPTEGAADCAAVRPIRAVHHRDSAGGTQPSAGACRATAADSDTVRGGLRCESFDLRNWGPKRLGLQQYKASSTASVHAATPPPRQLPLRRRYM